ncbi:MAG: gluconate 2-dehydrogenase subunit 3 family protein [Bacteroidota bacterium]
MLRRNAIKNIMLASGSLVTLPWWMSCNTPGKPALHQTSFSLREQEILASITDTIIPAGNTIGALTMEVDKFLQKLFDDCYEKPVQDNIKLQLKALDAAAETAHGKDFHKCSQQEREQLFAAFAGSNDQAKKDFFNLLRTETIRGFTTSKEVMVTYNNYKIAPGHYHGCVSIKA